MTKLSMCRQAELATLRGETKFQAEKGTGCQKHDGIHYSCNRQCISCSLEKSRINKRNNSEKRGVARYQHWDLERLIRVRDILNILIDAKQASNE